MKNQMNLTPILDETSSMHATSMTFKESSLSGEVMVLLVVHKYYNHYVGSVFSRRCRAQRPLATARSITLLESSGDVV